MGDCSGARREIRVGGIAFFFPSLSGRSYATSLTEFFQVSPIGSRGGQAVTFNLCRIRRCWFSRDYIRGAMRAAWHFASADAWRPGAGRGSRRTAVCSRTQARARGGAGSLRLAGRPRGSGRCIRRESARCAGSGMTEPSVASSQGVPPGRRNTGHSSEERGTAYAVPVRRRSPTIAVPITPSAAADGLGTGSGSRKFTRMAAWKPLTSRMLAPLLPR